MKLSEIILHREKFKSTPTIFSRDIRQRFKNGQIKIDGEVIKDDIDLNIINLSDSHKKSKIIDAGEFICNILKIDENNIFKHQLIIFGFENIKKCNFKNDLIEILNNFFIIRISKKDIFVIKKKI